MGRGELAEVPPGYPSTDLYMLRTDEQWRNLQEPCADTGTPSAGVGPAGLFGWLRSKKIGKPVAVINCGVGNTRTDQWLPGSILYQTALARAQAAITRPGSYLGGYIVYIGANDAAAGRTSWADNTQAMLEDLQKQLGVGRVLVVVLPTTVPTDAAYPTWAASRTAQLSWASAPRRSAVQAPEGPWREDFKLHLTTAGNLELAQRLLDAL